MPLDKNLYNAVVIGENPEACFIVEGDKLHAVDEKLASFKKEESNPKAVLPLMREALRSLIQFSQGKVTPHFLNVDFEALSKSASESQQLIVLIENIFTHLPHNERNKLSSLIHHAQKS